LIGSIGFSRRVSTQDFDTASILLTMYFSDEKIGF
jgi:hypothetical protein